MSVSRYANVGTAVWTAPSGRNVPYLRRRLLPAPGSLATLRTHEVRLGERVDTIAAAEIGDAEMSWLLADANLAMRPTELARPGGILVIPLPAGVPGAASGQ
ncbi:MAG: hypothetical protein JOY56_10130 [Solirubrobacterales bacterium]|nr:hypothetical protein [Solirubrobacterales bacterium]MBV8946313.1 hypothetical protein [Solirubrobacterales bacterium]MBV9681446.1 hypothetical protein [Solirubrobacterales bacterium]MBV9805978.1 hypothetical protein [Solirubrobacterales bacterium]